MRRALTAFAVLLGVLLAGGALLERAALEQARSAGVVWESMEREPLGRVFTGVQRGPVRVETLRWSLDAPRRVVLEGVDLDLAAIGGGGGGGGEAADLPALEVELRDLRVRYGERVLAEGLHGAVREGRGRVEGEGLELELPGPDGARAVAHVRRELSTEMAKGEVEAELLWTDPPTARLRAERLMIHQDLLSAEPFPVREIRVELTGEPATREATGTLQVGALQAGLRVRCEAGCEVDVDLPEGPVADALAPLAALIPELARAEVEGRVGGTAHLTLREGVFDVSVEPKLSGLRVRGAVGNLSALRGGVFEYLVTGADGARHPRASGEGTAGWTSLREVSPYLIAAVIASEDAGFRGHSGYDPGAIAEALARNREEGRVVRGGSTLTQQLAKNLFLDGERTLQRKIRELLLATELDASLGKERVLELYLNVVEWGPDFWGISAACDRYFLKKPSNLNPTEAAFLAALLPNPRGYYRWWYRDGRPNRQVISDILANMARTGKLSPEEAQRWAAEPLRFVPPPR